jgi:hypothetical protein
MEIVAARKEWRTVPDPSLLFTAINLYLCILFSIMFDGQKLHETSSAACSQEVRQTLGEKIDQARG